VPYFLQNREERRFAPLPDNSPSIVLWIAIRTVLQIDRMLDSLFSSFDYCGIDLVALLELVLMDLS
jgi:hypothetical protein